MYISDDTGDEGFYEVDLGLDGLFGTGDDLWTGFETEVAFGAGDAEGITYDPNQGVLFLADGSNSEVYRIDLGEQLGRIVGMVRAAWAAIGGKQDTGLGRDRWLAPLFLATWYCGMGAGYLMGPAHSSAVKAPRERES